MSEYCFKATAFIGVHSRLIPAWCLILGVSTAGAAEESAPLIKRLDDQTRARVLAALAGLIILGFALVLLTWLGARVTQRYRKGTSYFRPAGRPGEHDWARKPLAPPGPRLGGHNDAGRQE